MKKENRIFSILLAISSLAIFHIFCLRGIYADGASFLVKILEKGTFENWDQSRRFVQIITQAPVVLALKLGISNFITLKALHSLGLFFFPTLLWILALIRLKGEKFFWLYFTLFSLIYLNTSFYSIGEFNLTYSMVGYSFAILISLKRIDFKHGLFHILISLTLVRSYEALIFLGPLLGLACILRIHNPEVPLGENRIWFYIPIFFYSLATAVSGLSILHPRDPGNLKGALGSLNHLVENKQLLISLIISLLYFSAYFFPLGRSLKQGITCVIVILNTALLFPTNWATPFQHYQGRSLVGIILFVSLSILLIEARFGSKWNWIKKRDTNSNHLIKWITPCLLFMVLSTIDISQTIGHFSYLREFSSFVNSHTGFYPIEKTGIDYKKYGWPWTQPSLSLLLRESEENTAIVLNRADYMGWQPYPAPREFLPDISRYYPIRKSEEEKIDLKR